MTTTITLRYVALLLTTFAFIGITFASASEVTGTLSSVASDTGVAGQVSGTVVSDGGTSSGGSSGRSGGSSLSTPSPSPILAAVTNSNLSSGSAVSPGFPNAGFAPEEGIAHGAVIQILARLVNTLAFIAHI